MSWKIVKWSIRLIEVRYHMAICGLDDRSVALLAGNRESMEPIKKSKASSVKSICVGEDKKLRPKVIVNFRLSVPIIPFKN